MRGAHQAEPARHRCRAAGRAARPRQDRRATCSARRSSPARASARRARQYDSTNSQFVTNIHFKNNDFVDKIAGPLVGKQVAIELDGVVQSAPTINPGITGRDVADQRQLHAGRGEGPRARAALRRAADPVRPGEADRAERVADARQGPAHRGHRGRSHRPRARRALHAALLPAARPRRGGRARAHRHDVLHAGVVPVDARTASRSRSPA